MMASLQELKRYYNHHFEDWGGYTSKDYKTFETKYINYLRSICKKNALKLEWASRNHYEFSAMISNPVNNKFVYMSISDVRYWLNEWANHILFREARHAKDYHGLGNQYTTLDNLESNIRKVVE